MSIVKLRIVHCVIASVLSIGLFCLVFFLRQDFSFKGWSDAFFVSGAVMVAFGGLSFIASRGLFDMMGYGMYRVVGAFKFKGELRYQHAIDFKEARLEKRRKNPFFFQIYLIIGGVLILLAILFSILFLNVK